MVVAHERCQICGKMVDFLMSDDEVLLREAKCSHCGASLRNSDTAGEIIRHISGNQTGLRNQQERLSKYKILNTCASGYIHGALKNLDGYTCSEFFDDIPIGEYYEGILCVDLCNIPFGEGTFDIIITEDIFEHIAGYETAMAEIYRVLKAGGCHIFTVPLHDGRKTVSREGKKEVYHGDPIHADRGCLVITDWGDDIKSIVEGFGYRVDVIRKHDFYKADEITIVDETYDEYLDKRDCLNRYLKYNSTVIVAYKDTPIQSISNNETAYSLDKLEEMLRDKERKIISYNRTIRDRNEMIQELNNDNERRGKHIVKLDRQIEEKNAWIRSLQKENTQRDQHIRYLDSVIEKNDRMLSAYRTEIDRGKQQLELQRRSTDKQLQKFTQQNLINEQRIASLEQTLRNKEGHIEQLLEAERAFEREKGTHAYKVGKKLQKFGDLLLPPDSHRRFLARVVFNTFRHPVVMSNVINPARIKKYFKYRKSGDMEGIKRGFGEAIRTEKMCLSGNEISEVPILTAAGDRFDKMAFQIFNEPTVSIVIPVYNEFQYTYNCLMSILNHSGDVAYEIIIADDRSTDQTKDITDIVSGIKVVRTAENLRFLRNCNHAAKHAEGKYILFLNNDTQVQENWLQPLVRLIESDERIGMVGSKLIYPDGYLQEAGGILWKDGSAWNYGNRKNPEDPEYNYVKEADYISGAAVMIKRSLWHKIGGFDERFVPAYCEDSDLAFAVRAQGYKVLYQPLSVVVHFEGVSNGTDLSGGQKLYQTKNQQKLVEKWTEVLERDHFPNAENVFTARDRNRYKPVLLMVDHYVPQYDKDAGSRTVFQYLKMFVDKGYNVKFIGDNFYRHEPYTTTLQQMGIEVLYGPYYAQNWKKWIQKNSGYIQYVFLNRPHIAVKYIDFIRENTQAKIIYYGHDLHFLREMRKYELTRDEQTLAESKDWREKELSLMKQSDVVYYPSNVETAAIKKIDDQINAKAIVAYIYENVEPKEYHFDERKDIMFIGGFTHTPNVDAVLWFGREIMPGIIEKIPDMKWYVMGSNPPQAVIEMAGDNIIVKGFVSDEELEDHYSRCRMSVVPLRYGAGIKGKVVEAMRYGMPVVTTPVGAEGITGAEEILCIADDARTLADEIIDKYNNMQYLEQISAKSYEYIQSNFSQENAWDVVKDDFGMIVRRIERNDHNTDTV